jgi:hypothetical protein
LGVVLEMGEVDDLGIRTGVDILSVVVVVGVVDFGQEMLRRVAE